MATTFTLEVKKVPTSQGVYPIFIRITKERKHKRIRTSVSISRLADWNPKGAKNQNWIRTSERNAEVMNEALVKELEEVTSLYRDDRKASIESLVQRMKNKDASNSFLEFARSASQELADMGRSNAKHYMNFCKKFESFLESEGKKDILFSELTPHVVSGFDSFLRKETNEKLKKEEKRLHPNYIRTLLVKCRALINKAIKEGLLPVDKYPFRNHPIPKEIETRKEALDEAEINGIVALEYPKGSLLWHTKNAFLFSFYCAGIRAGDLIQLRWNNIKDEGARLEYVMGKNHKQRNYPLMPQAKAILAQYRTNESQRSDYIFPLLDCSAKYAKDSDVDTMPVELKKQLFSQIYSKNALLNKYLKKIASDAGISKNLSFHISRHSFASLARGKAVPSKVVQEALAHSSLSTTERYLHNFSTEEVDNALQVVFDTKESRVKTLLEELKRMSDEERQSLLDKLK